MHSFIANTPKSKRRAGQLDIDYVVPAKQSTSPVPSSAVIAVHGFRANDAAPDSTISPG